MKTEFKIYSEACLIEVAKYILDNTNDKIFIFQGDLGVGKTTFIKYFCIQLEIVDNVTSPTFPIINEYINNKNESIFHFDFYRLDALKDVREIGAEMYLNSGNYCFIEWPDLIKNYLPDNYVSISMFFQDDYRLIKIY